ncbi:MAG TPA: ABC transporter ATP-binding protein [Desulfatiglandales bacterium]|nr:ABC transporter ATP-binding protein [Desulfatiglandales bacterium]
MRPFREFKTLKVYFIQNRIALALGLSSLLLVDALQLFIPRIIKKSVDALTIGQAHMRLLVIYALAIVGIALTMAIFRYVWRYLVFGHARKVEEALRNRIYRHLQTLSLRFYWQVKTGDLMARAVNDIDAVRMAAGMGLVAMTDGVVLGLATIGFMLYIDVKLTLISLIPTPFIVYFTLIITRRIGKGFRQVQQGFSEVTESVREAFAGIRVIKAYNRQSWEYGRVRQKGETYVKYNLELAKNLAIFFPLMTLFTNLGLALVIWIGGRLTILGNITTGDFVAFISYLNLLMWPLMALGWVTNLIQRGSASMRRINALLEEVPEITNRTSHPYTGPIRGRIELRGVSFYYPQKEEPALRDITLTIGAGQTVAIVGGVGSGKSTLLHTLPRLVEIEQGLMLIDGIPVHEIDLANLRRSIGFVTQEPHVFSDTILNNILFGRQGTSEDWIKTVLEVSQMASEIDSFPQGIYTLLGERGSTLSGGQRQRLTIARALISNPPILILDDALSQVDTRTETAILNGVLEMRLGKTNIIVSHRLSTLRKADIVYVLKSGDLVEQGDHQTLLAAGQEYTRLYERLELTEELEDGR